MKHVIPKILSFRLKNTWLKGILGGAAAALLLFAFWLYWGTRPVGGAPQSFNIPKGQQRIKIAQRLENAHLVRSWTHFLVFSYVERKVVLAGDFSIDPKTSLFTVLDTLSSEEKKHQVVTIPEGWRREQIADLLATKNVNRSEFLTQTEGLEGRLFPDTYYISAEPKTSEVIEKFTSNFTAKTSAYTVTDTVLGLAAIVEREAKNDSERALIAGIYQNRLNRGMKLEADPTVQYGRDSNLIKSGNPPKEYWQSITVADYQGVNSRYNTYLYVGLPPSPIANPGVKSIEAALNPAQTSAIYFFHTANGEIVTSKTHDEHVANKRKYL